MKNETEIIDKLFLELSHVSNAKTARELRLEDLLVSARCISQRHGKDTAWDRFDKAIANECIGCVTPRVFKILPSDTE